ncbi:hypothetical protein JCM10207_002708 [Rhodosporidiobolus poonsookiae]
MPPRVTRSATKAASSPMPPPASPKKRPSAAPPSTPKRSKTATTAPASPYVPPTPGTQQKIDQAAHDAEEEDEKEGAVLLHPELKFKYADARKHLEQVDSRWGIVMDKLKCKPFDDEEELSKPFNPFRSLVSSLLGQQISWLAARAIQHKFCRLFFPSLPEKLPPPDAATPRTETPFPTPHQILDLPDRTAALRGAGLSGRKVEYVVELAERFADGRLDAKKLWAMDDDELYKELVAIRGIGPWTVDIAKRQDVLPVGDLGIQKNLCRWFSHDPSLAPSIHPRKLAPASPTKLGATESAQVPPSPSPAAVEFASAADPTGDSEGQGVGVGKLAEMGAADVEREAVVDLNQPEDGDEAETVDASGFTFPETSSGLTPGVLKSRLGGKKLKGGMYLSPTEMAELTEAWRPYRSVACWYLWSLSDGTGDP